MDTEIWKDVKGFEGLYKVSSLGNVMSINYKHTGVAKNLRKQINRKGYYSVMLYKNKIPKRIEIHRLVAIAFVENEHNYPQVNHIDENSKNNSFDNLEWVTLKQNINYGTCQKRKAISRSRPVIQYNLNNEKIAVYFGSKEAGRITGIDDWCICMCCKKLQKTAGGYIWRYEKE